MQRRAARSVPSLAQQNWPPPRLLQLPVSTKVLQPVWKCYRFFFPPKGYKFIMITEDSKQDFQITPTPNEEGEVVKEDGKIAWHHSPFSSFLVHICLFAVLACFTTRPFSRLLSTFHWIKRVMWFVVALLKNSYFCSHNIIYWPINKESNYSGLSRRNKLTNQFCVVFDYFVSCIAVCMEPWYSSCAHCHIL